MRMVLLLGLLAANPCVAFAPPYQSQCGTCAHKDILHQSSSNLNAIKRRGLTLSRISERRRTQNLFSVKCLEFAQPEFATFPQQMFTLVNFAVLPFWGMMIVTPKWEATKFLMSSSFPILLLCAIHLSLVSFGVSQPSAAEEFQFLATQGFVKLSSMMEMRNYPIFVSEEWAHVLAWDLFVGRWIYLDGLKKNIPTPHSLFFCFLLGPLGFLIHLATRAFVKRSLASLAELD